MVYYAASYKLLTNAGLTWSEAWHATYNSTSVSLSSCNFADRYSIQHPKNTLISRFTAQTKLQLVHASTDIFSQGR